MPDLGDKPGPWTHEGRVLEQMGQLGAECPHCDRAEGGFDNELTARAWLTGHIQEEHADELPSFSGVE